MSVTYVPPPQQQQQGGGGGSLGDLLSLGGMLIPGAGWMGALGTGVNAANGLMNGNTAGAASIFNGINEAGGFNEWLNTFNKGNLMYPQGGISSEDAVNNYARRFAGI